MKTPKIDKKQSEVHETERGSGKKLVQARLPFKILSTPIGSGDAKPRNDTDNDSGETRKRKLSYENEDGTAKQTIKKKSDKNTIENNVEKKAKITPGKALPSNLNEVVLLSDSDAECDTSGSKENVKKAITAAKILKQKDFESDHEADMHSDDVDLIASSDEDPATIETKPIVATPKNLKNSALKSKTKIGTVNSASKASDKDKVVGETTSEKPKVLIKLPVSAKKNKRRKISVQLNENAEERCESDDVELASAGSQPQKRPRLERDVKQKAEIVNKMEETIENKVENKRTEKREKLEATASVKPTTPNNNKNKDKNPKATTPKINKKNKQLKQIKSPKNEKKSKQEVEPSRETKSSNEEVVDLVELSDDESMMKCVENDKKTDHKYEPLEEKKFSAKEEVEIVKENEPMSAAETENKESKNIQKDLEKVVQQTTKDTSPVFQEETTTESDSNKSKMQEISSSSTDTEADAETETTVKNDAAQPENKLISSTDSPSTSKILNDSANKLHKKNLTPKQQKLLEQRLKAREEKERKIQEERLQKQREKEERELAKKREREERDEQKRREREEKEEQRRIEREEKERKRLAELELKNEEKRKRNEAKEEEIRKKEEERKRKEQEKEEAELKKKKAAMAFTKFFSRPPPASGDQKCKENDGRKEDEDKVLAFRPFQIKGAMKLAPTVRKQLTHKDLSTLDTILEQKQQVSAEELYINQLKTGAINPHKWVRLIQEDSEENKLAEEPDEDVVIVEDGLERAGQAIVEEPVAPVERLRVKFFKFTENRRPPYYGTWRKKSQTITPRKPFAQDKKFFDYEVDSDEEWEEEEPGESLDGSDDDKEKESEDEDYEVDNEWFVPHGHLSDEELQCEDELGENNDREAQKAKLQILQKEFAQEMKKKTEKIKPRLIGCIWVDENGNQPELCPKIIWNTLNTRAILCAEPPVLEEIEDNSETNATNATQGSEKNSGETKLKPIALNESMVKQLVTLVHGNTHSKNFIIKEFIAYVEANEESVRNGDVKVPLKSAIREKIDEYAQWQVLEKTDHEKDDVSSLKKKKNKKKLCWVVSQEKLKEMDMESLDLKNNWQYILQPRAKKTEVKIDATLVTLTPTEDSNEHSEASVEKRGSPPAKTKPITDMKKFTKVFTAEEKAQQLKKSKEISKTPSTKTAPSTKTTPSAKSTPSTASDKQTTLSTVKADSANNNNATPTAKKRVPLLMSVARGQTISTPDKNARISQFLKTLNDAKQTEKTQTTSVETPPSAMDVDEIVLLD